MSLSKTFLGRVVRILESHGIRHIVISPGSRNAPLILAFTSRPGLEVFTIPDERSAAHFALGLAQQTGKPAVLVCTSGTAPLNYSPAVAEAFYQKIPMLVFTADRPADHIDQGDGQTIRQNGIYNNFIKKSFLFPQEILPGTEEANAGYLINEAVLHTLVPEPGPVHINFPFTEPLYGFEPDFSTPVQTLPVPDPGISLPDDLVKGILRTWENTRKKMIITGQMLPGHGIAGLLTRISEDQSVVVMTETTSNLPVHDQFITGIDKVVETILPEEEQDFAPELVITLGGHIVSRKIKSFISRVKPSEHWHITPAGTGMDMFGRLTRTLTAPANVILEILEKSRRENISAFREQWKIRATRSDQRMTAYMANIPFSDLKVFEIVLGSIPGQSLLHLGNSTPVRYHQLFRQKQPKLRVFGNRGVSGIDGTVSTAAGAAWTADAPVYLITGDMGFFYDANGLWHDYLLENLKIIVINNGGGGIFRFIDGPAESGKLPFFEAPHNLSARPVAEMHGLNYLQAKDDQTLRERLSALHRNPGPSLLEIFTPRETNGFVLKAYFSELKRPD
ncbi:MAG: 2-succinyl-5-enolpyruvyl-6-hydroxy-3-cyclohexene-1-carboxylic-acid synthase [Chlorobi bacterium]|nr:2-succinyl-5-enolpyruvyl-6-hydroxy-3-cyclohexene-1-carboxylic-acid synthase [Chlorobiota bacterium]